ncbi:LLM class flavin-dependent oxidoreductase [Amycolatopsis sacchari]|uniref:LLM class flavin-dependent oxidoreductase n=1 Tax=Amycolatopsis sacchari TaxID=115433 RepID=UPI003D70C836
MSGNPLAVLVSTTTPPEQVGPTAALTEELGFGDVWVAEDYFCYGGFTAAAAALNATERITVNLGVIASVARHPAVTAMEIANLARTHPGRFRAGIGHGVPFWTNQMGLTPKSPLATLDECVTGVRRLLAGETLDVEGKRFTFRSVALSHPATQPVPILTGVVGPKSLKLSGRIADGTVMSVLAGTKYLESAVAHIREGIPEGSTQQHEVPTFALFSVHEDSQTAKNAARASVAMYLAALGPHNPLSGAFGYNDRLAELLSDGGTDRLTREMPDEWVDELAVAGNPDEVTQRVRALLAAGATSVVLAPVTPETATDELRLAAKTVLPRFG